MNRVERLLQELCPEGVEYRKLEDIGCLFSGLTGKSKEDFKDGNAKFVSYMNVYSNPALNLNIEDKVQISDGEEQNTIQYGDILFTGSSETPEECGMTSIVTQMVEEAIYLNSFCFGLRLNNVERFDVNFLKHLFRCDSIRKLLQKTANGVTRFNVSKKRLLKIEIPVPPLEVQTQIAYFLDHFTELTAELQAELQARKEQYEYYRNKLLTFEEGDESVRWMKMSEIGEFYGGLSGKSKSDFENGKSKYVTYMNVYNNLALNTHIADMVKIDEGEKQNAIQYGDALFTGSSETPEECGMSSVVTEDISESIYLNSFCFGFRPYDKSLYYPGFFKHLLRSKAMRQEIIKTANGVTRFNVSKKLMGKIKLPILPSQEQIRLASILDKFETLVNDLSQGLPAEIAAVQEQYEYYRNKLLTFNRKA